MSEKLNEMNRVIAEAEQHLDGIRRRIQQQQAAMEDELMRIQAEYNALAVALLVGESTAAVRKTALKARITTLESELADYALVHSSGWFGREQEKIHVMRSRAHTRTKALQRYTEQKEVIKQHGAGLSYVETLMLLAKKLSLEEDAESWLASYHARDDAAYALIPEHAPEGEDLPPPSSENVA